MAEEDELRDSDVVDKMRETGGRRMTIGDILSLFAYIAYSLLILPFVWWIQLQIDKAVKGQHQSWYHPSHQK